MKTVKTKFGKEYFKGYYHRNVGSFTKKDLEKSTNWFSGWFSYLQKFVDLKKGEGRRVLEIGCSIGGTAHLLYDAGFDTYATDISSFAISGAKKLAKQLKKKINFYTFDVEKNIPIDGKFDLIIAFEVIEHLRSPMEAIIRMKNKLKKNGILICSTPNAVYDMSQDPTHINVKSDGEWEKIFRRAGFSKIKKTQVSFLPLFYNLNRKFHLVIPIPIRSKYINSPLFIIATG